MSIDRMARLILRRQGIGVKEKVIRFRGSTIIFRFNQNGYDVLVDGAKTDFVQTSDINEAVRIYKSTP